MADTSHASSQGDMPTLARTQTDPNFHTCFICLSDSTETPDELFIHACTCSLEAHETCLLTWISESEATATDDSIHCPACKSKIKVVEPHDALVQYADKLHRELSRTSPKILATMVLGGTLVGTSVYGAAALEFVAGERMFGNWLGMTRLLQNTVRLTWWDRHGLFEVSSKMGLLTMVAPSLLLHKALPRLGNSLMFLPMSVIFSIQLSLQNRPLEWPPSPVWALCSFPYVSLLYDVTYRRLFGRWEKELNRALKGTLASENAAAAAQQQQQQQQPAAQAQVPAQPPAPNMPADDEDEGIMASLFRIGNIILDLLGNGDNGRDVMDAQVQIVINEGDDPEQVIEELRQNMQDDLQDAVGDDNAIVVIDGIHFQETPPAEADQYQDPIVDFGTNQVIVEDLQQENDNDGADPPPDIPVAPVAPIAPPAPVPAPGPAAQENQMVERRATLSLTDVINGTVSALALPYIAGSIGEILNVILPTAWVMAPRGYRPFLAFRTTKAPALGLLQQRWGRSLVGGCLYIVLRDAAKLYIKYRRVQVRKNRHVKSVPRRRGGGHVAAGDREAATP